jgi:CheY-like chemotaxis protein
MAPPYRILVVEDDEIISNLITTILEHTGYHVVGKTNSGEDAILKAATLEPDLVLMDIHLSGQMDGITAARYIFNLFHYPIVFLTAFFDDKLLELAKQAQPLGYIIKPFTDKVLASTIGLALYNHDIRKKFHPVCPIGEPKKIMTSQDPILIIDTTGKVVFYNPSTVRFIERSEDQILMHSWKDVLTLINEVRGVEIPDPVSEVIRQMHEITYDFDTAVVTKTKKSRRASVTVGPIKDDRNKLFCLFMHIKEKIPERTKMTTSRI